MTGSRDGLLVGALLIDGTEDGSLDGDRLGMDVEIIRGSAVSSFRDIPSTIGALQKVGSLAENEAFLLHMLVKF